MEINRKEFKIEFVTAPILKTNESEVRPTTIKGLLRFWWRQLYSGDNLMDMYKRDAEIFGSTDKASTVILDVENDEKNIKAGSTFNLMLEYPKNFEDELIKTLRLWLTFGGIGGKQHLGNGKLFSKELPYIEREEISEFNIKKEDYFESVKTIYLNTIIKDIYHKYKKNKDQLIDKKNKPFFVGINKYNNEYKLKLLFYRKMENYLNTSFRNFFEKLKEDL